MKQGDILQDRYRIEGVLGQGSMGTTHKAFDLAARRPVAVKQLHLAQMRDWKTLDMFEREARILQQLHHPRIPAYQDYFTLESPEGTQFLLVQEFVEGKTLKQLVEEGWRGTEREILEIFLDLVDILVFLHTLCPPVIHRDVNPKNIIISPNVSVFPAINDVYLVDFGAVQDRIRTTVLAGTTVVGTFGYIPFEQFSGQAVPASDYYALGATLLYMLTHRHPSEFPTEGMKPQFEPFLHNSPGMMRLLNGLLEPSLKTRVASPEAIRNILDECFQTPFWLSGDIVKPAATKIEKLTQRPGDLSFRIPKQVIGLTLKRTVLRLTPAWTYASEELLGIHGGELWRVPTQEIEPSDLTWFFGKQRGVSGQPVFGINHAGETHEIGLRLNKAEIQWLTQEIQDYLWEAKTLPAQPEEPAGDGQSSRIIERGADVFPRPTDSQIKKTQRGEDQLRFRIPKVTRAAELADRGLVSLVCLAIATLLTASALFLMSNELDEWGQATFMLMASSAFWGCGFGLLLITLFRVFGGTVLHLTPEWIKISRRCFGIGYSRHIPTAAVGPFDVIRYFHKNTLRLGINYAQKTLPLASGITPPESEWLIQEISEYIARFARPIPNVFGEPDLEMK